MKHLLATYDSRELSEWQAYYRIYPEPQERGDLRAGHIAAGIFNSARSASQTPAHASDFVYKAPLTLEDIDGPGQEERTANTKQAMAMLRGN